MQPAEHNALKTRVREFLTDKPAAGAGQRCWETLAPALDRLERQHLAEHIAAHGGWTLAEVVALPSSGSCDVNGQPAVAFRPFRDLLSDLRSRDVVAYASTVFEGYRLRGGDRDVWHEFERALAHQRELFWHNTAGLPREVMEQYIANPAVTYEGPGCEVDSLLAVWGAVDRSARRRFLMAVSFDQVPVGGTLCGLAAQCLHEADAEALFDTLWRQTRTPQGRLALLASAGADAPWLDRPALVREVVDALAGMAALDFPPRPPEEARRFLRRVSHRAPYGSWVVALCHWHRDHENAEARPEAIVPLVEEWWRHALPELTAEELIDPLMKTPPAVRAWLAEHLADVAPTREPDSGNSEAPQAAPARAAPARRTWR